MLIKILSFFIIYLDFIFLLIFNYCIAYPSTIEKFDPTHNIEKKTDFLVHKKHKNAWDRLKNIFGN
jgi:hypothetical protein